MSASVNDILDSLTGKVNLLVSRYNHVKEQRDEARAQLQEQADRIQQLEKALERADTELQRLRITHVLAPTPDDVLRARALLTELVKKTDRCISRLRKD